MTVPFVTAHFEIFHCTHNPLIPTSDLYFTFCSILKALVRKPNFENCLDLIFAALPYEKVIVVIDTNYITSAIRKFMLDMPSPGSFQNIGVLI